MNKWVNRNDCENWIEVRSDGEWWFDGDVIGIWWFYIGSLNKIIANMPINKYLLGYCNAVEKYIW